MSLSTSASRADRIKEAFSVSNRARRSASRAIPASRPSVASPFSAWSRRAAAEAWSSQMPPAVLRDGQQRSPNVALTGTHAFEDRLQDLAGGAGPPSSPTRTGASRRPFSVFKVRPRAGSRACSSPRVARLNSTGIARDAMVSGSLPMPASTFGQNVTNERGSLLSSPQTKVLPPRLESGIQHAAQCLRLLRSRQPLGRERRQTSPSSSRSSAVPSRCSPFSAPGTPPTDTAPLPWRCRAKNGCVTKASSTSSSVVSSRTLGESVNRRRCYGDFRKPKMRVWSKKQPKSQRSIIRLQHEQKPPSSAR